MLTSFADTRSAFRGERDCALDDVAQLPHVAGPVMLLQHRDCARLDLNVVRRTCSTRKVVSEQRNVVEPLDKGRHANDGHTNPVVQIFPEPSNSYEQFDVGIGRRDRAEVTLVVPVCADGTVPAEVDGA